MNGVEPIRSEVGWFWSNPANGAKDGVRTAYPGAVPGDQIFSLQVASNRIKHRFFNFPARDPARDAASRTAHCVNNR